MYMFQDQRPKVLFIFSSRTSPVSDLDIVV